MKIQILGMGCPKCKQLAANAEQAVKEAIEAGRKYMRAGSSDLGT